ncbi:MAG: glycosyl hydrolase [Bacteroidota bacterium]
MRNLFVVLLCAFCITTSWAQLTQPPFTPAVERMKGVEKRQALQEQSVVAGIPFRSAGPTVFSGRVADIDVWEKDPSHFYVAYASGGLWKTENNGTTFYPLFDQEAVMTIGDIAVDWNTNTIWVGTGEVNASRSSYAGMGVYKSTDGGKNWQHLGLGESHHIGRILLHPTDPNTAWVAVLGHLYSPNQERGLYKTTDGGKSWKRTLFIHDNAGVVDLMIDPDNPDRLYAASWERTRRAWNFVESGNGSGIHLSEDGGETWSLLTTKSSGFPTGEGVGRIGLAMMKENGKPVLYASLDNYFRRPKKEEKSDNLTKDMLRSMSKEAFLKLPSYKIKDYLRSNRFPDQYDVKAVKKMIKQDEIKPKALVEYTENANSLLFDTPVIGLEVYRSDDAGKSWKRTHDDYIDAVYNSYGYYFGQIRVAPDNSDKVYALGVPVMRSDDGGKSFTSINGANVHGDHHALWINPARPGHLVLGNDGGINISYDDGENWIKCNSPAVGQFYAIAVDMAEPYNIYGGLQDNGVWFGSSNYKASERWHSTGQYPYRSILGGDGMQVAVDTRDNKTVYTGFQFGNYFRINTETGKRKFITPKHQLGESPLRWNWQTPVHISVHNQDILYIGAHKLYRSFNRGDDFTAISEDLTTGGIKGDVAFSTLASIHESPLQFGLIYTGSDDGLVHVTRDGGVSWENITQGLPEDMWVSRVQASAHEKGRVYVSLNGYRWDDFRAFIYQSDDYGKTWQRLGRDLPLEPVNVFKEDPSNEDVLYVGTDHGTYVSLDRGQSFMAFMEGLPLTPVHDLVIHDKAKDLVIGTHGRSIYVGSVKELQQLDNQLLKKDLHAFAMDAIRYSSRWGNSRAAWREASTPKVHIPIYASEKGPVEIEIRMGKDLLLKKHNAVLSKGLNYVEYDLSMDDKQLEAYNKALNKKTKKDAKPIQVKQADNGMAYLHKGEYAVKVSRGNATAATSLKVK